MDDYIKREDALEQFDYYDLGEYLTTQIRGMLMDVPSADVAPVRRGRLVDAGVSASGHRLAMCTICKRKMREGVEIGIVSRYCPNCGAKMDEEETKE